MTGSKILGMLVIIAVIAAYFLWRGARTDEMSTMIREDILVELSKQEQYRNHQDYLEPLVINAHDSAFSMAYSSGSFSRFATREMRRESFSKDTYMRALRLGIVGQVDTDISSAPDVTTIKRLELVKESVDEIWSDLGFEPIGI